MGTGIFGIGVSALNVAQMGLATTSHNIANVNTPGYNRQEVIQGARLAQLTGAGFIGQGADASTVQRVYDEFLAGQVLQGQGQASYLDTYYTQIKQIDSVLADPNAGLSPSLQDFFSAVNGVASTPESQAARQTMLSSAQALVSRFQSLNNRLVEMNNSINGQIISSVTSINSYAQEIAALNQNIVLARSSSNGQPPNDLMDQRDQIISQLNKEISTTVVKQSDGSYNVFVGNGQALVVGAQSFTMQTVQSTSDPSKLDVAYLGSGGTTVRFQQNSLQGGNLGGLIAFRNQSLDQAQNALGRVAIGLAGTFNAQHQLGQDLNGALGGSFFNVAVPVVNANTTNTGTAVIGTNISSYSALTASDYLLQYTGGTAYTLIRLSDNTVTNLASLPQTVDGLSISVTSGTPAVGDSFMIRPTVNGAQNISLAINDTSKIAAAAPIRGNAALTNSGTGKITSGTVNAPPPVNANLQQLVSIVFNNPPTTYNVTGTGTGNPVNVPYTAGASISYNGWTVQISGAPAAGDTFTVGANSNATADNRNALLLAALQTQNTLAGGTASYQGAYGQLVSMVGNKTREMQVTSQAQASMVEQAVLAQQSKSGVNLDEEAANMLRYQRAYEAAGKAMQIANTMFDTLLGLGK